MTVKAEGCTSKASQFLPVDLWLWQPDLDQKRVQESWQLLDATEKDRASKFVRPSDANRYCVTHAQMRQILSRYRDQEPQDLVFSTTGQKKPILSGGPAFNLSHSGEMAALAVCRSGAAMLGVDIELLRDIEPEVLAHIFADQELDFLGSLRDVDRRRAVIRGWTWKEAILKASGFGLHVEPQTVVFDLSRQHTPKVLSVPPSLDTPSAWTVQNFDAGEGLLGCVAVRARAPIKIVPKRL